MAEVTVVKKTAPVPARVETATLILTQQEIAYLRQGLATAYNADKPAHLRYVTAGIRDLYSALDNAYNGKSSADVKAEKRLNDYKLMSYQDVFATRTF